MIGEDIIREGGQPSTSSQNQLEAITEKKTKF